MDEVVVTGERAGPGLWHVHRGTAQLWILGTVTPLPKNMTWRSKQLEQVLDGTNQVLVRKPYEIGIARALWLLLTQRDLIMVGGGKRLKDVMPAELHARFAAQRAKSVSYTHLDVYKRQLGHGRNISRACAAESAGLRKRVMTLTRRVS